MYTRHVEQLYPEGPRNAWTPKRASYYHAVACAYSLRRKASPHAHVCSTSALCDQPMLTVKAGMLACDTVLEMAVEHAPHGRQGN